MVLQCNLGTWGVAKPSNIDHSIAFKTIITRSLVHIKSYRIQRPKNQNQNRTGTDILQMFPIKT